MSNAASVVFSVTAIVVGAGGALLVQHLNNRVTTKQARAAAQATFRGADTYTQRAISGFGPGQGFSALSSPMVGPWLAF